MMQCTQVIFMHNLFSCYVTLFKCLRSSHGVVRPKRRLMILLDGDLLINLNSSTLFTPLDACHQLICLFPVIVASTGGDRRNVSTLFSSTCRRSVLPPFQIDGKGMTLIVGKRRRRTMEEK